MENTLQCLRCGSKMGFIRREYIQLGKTGWVIGDWGNLLAGAMDVAIFGCPKCGKLEFFQGSREDVEALVHNSVEGDHIAQVRCPACGVEYDMDYTKCPRCGAKNATY